MNAHPQCNQSADHRLLSLLLLFAVWMGFAPVDAVAEQSTEEVVLSATKGRQWYKGNLHTHSHWSDGDDYLSNIALWYRERQYQFLVFTDHNTLAQGDRWVDVEKTKGGRVAFDKLIKNFGDKVETRQEDGKTLVRLETFAEVSRMFNDPGRYLLIQGEEISDRFQRYPIHLNASNVQENILPRGGGSVVETIQNNVNAVIRQREETGEPIMVHVNHPNFGYAITAEELMQIVGEPFFEVYNGHPSVHNKGDATHASTERMWDLILTKRLAELELPVMYGIAVDDGHNYHHIPSRRSEPGRGWVMVCAKELSPKSLIDALERGEFYSSSGVTLKQVSSSAKDLRVEVDPVEGETYSIEFIGTRKGYDPKGKPVLNQQGEPIHATYRYSDEIGAVLKTVKGTRASYEFQGDEIYVRTRVTANVLHPNPAELGDRKSAWVQPVVLQSSSTP